MTKPILISFAGLMMGLAFASTGAVATSNSNVQLMTDGKLVPSAVYRWSGKPIEVTFDFGEERMVGGVRIMSGRSWVNCGVRRASFYAPDGQDARRPSGEAPDGQDARRPRGEAPDGPDARRPSGKHPDGQDARRPRVLAEHVSFGPANTFKEVWTSWKPVTCRGVKMVIEDTWDRIGAYYDYYSNSAFYDVSRMFGGPVWDLWGAGGWGSLKVDAETIMHPQAVEWIGNERTVQIAEVSFFGAEVPGDLPRPNAPDVAFPRARLLRDWAYQEAAPGGNVSLVANTTADTTKPDRRGRVLLPAAHPADPRPQLRRLPRRVASRAAAQQARRRAREGGVL